MSGGFLLDTNIPSEFTKAAPEPRVSAWVASRDDLYLSVITVGELRRGFSLLPAGKRRADLEDWFDRLLPSIASKIMPITESIANRWGEISAERQRAGMPLGMADGLIAATALEHDLAVVTRNVKHFASLGITLINPWED